jgi:hypothetical protein
MTKVKYFYDYPINRDVSKHLTPTDKQFISERTGFSKEYVRLWCIGRRKSRPIDELARKVMKLNIAKQRKLNNISQS